MGRQLQDGEGLGGDVLQRGGGRPRDARGFHGQAQRQRVGLSRSRHGSGGGARHNHPANGGHGHGKQPNTWPRMAVLGSRV
eukprot:8302982-Lingulodinium_polyedra.AAC.1